jgi:hypothetical protein
MYLADDIGHLRYPMQVQFSNPTDGYYAALQIVADTGNLRNVDIQPVPLGASPVVVMVPDAARQYTVAVGSNYLMLFGGTGLPYDITYARHATVIPLGNPNIDASSSDLSFLDGMGAFGT